MKLALDTNLLVYAHRAGTPEHRMARKAIEGAVNRERAWGIPFPCLAEFWAVVTHPRCVGGASSTEQARTFIQGLLEDGGGEVWHPGSGFGMRLLQAARQRELHGSRIFDLQIGLIAYEAGASEMWSHDRSFVTPPGLKLVDPL